MGDTVLCVRRVLLILILCQQSHSSCETVNKDLCLEHTLKTWTEASEGCDLFVSNTSLSVGIPVRGIPILEHLSPLQKSRRQDLHWIGATGKFTPWFELMGCYSYSNVYKQHIWNLTSNAEVGPVAECHQICEERTGSYQEFGINETHCFCREETKIGIFANKPCKLLDAQNFTNDLIGTKIDAGIAGIFLGFAVYRKRSATTKIEDTFGECLLETNEGNQTYPCDSADITQRTWAQAQKERKEINKKSLSRWTPYVRRLIISWKKGASVVQDGTVCIGVRHQNGTYEPLPLRCNETHSSICQKSDIATDTTTPRTTSSDSRTSRGRTTPAHQVTDTTIPHTTNSDLGTWRGPTTSVHQITDTTTALTTNSDSRISRGQTTSVHQVTDTTIPHTTNLDRRTWRGPTTSVHQITDTTIPRTTRSDFRTSWGQTTFVHQITGSSPVYSQNDNDDTTDPTLPLIIGSIAGLVCIVLVVIIIIVLIIKRRRPNKREISQSAPKQNVYYSEMPEDRNAQLVIEKESSPTVNNTDYDTMLSINNEKITEHSEEYGKLLPGGEDNVYNHTWDKPITEQLTDHVYSTTISGNDANVYDHTETNNANLPGVSGGDHGDSKAFTGNDASLYDHTETKCLDLPKMSDA